MQIHLTGRNIEITEALKTFTTEKFSKLEHHHKNIKNVNVTFHVENVTHVAEASLHLNGAEFHASAKSADMYSAIDALVDKIGKQITKHKEKMR